MIFDESNYKTQKRLQKQSQINYIENVSQTLKKDFCFFDPLHPQCTKNSSPQKSLPNSTNTSPLFNLPTPTSLTPLSQCIFLLSILALSKLIKIALFWAKTRFGRYLLRRSPQRLNDFQGFAHFCKDETNLKAIDSVDKTLCQDFGVWGILQQIKKTQKLLRTAQSWDILRGVNLDCSRPDKQLELDRTTLDKVKQNVNHFFGLISSVEKNSKGLFFLFEKDIEKLVGRATAAEEILKILGCFGSQQSGCFSEKILRGAVGVLKKTGMDALVDRQTKFVFEQAKEISKTIKKLNTNLSLYNSTPLEKGFPNKPFYLPSLAYHNLFDTKIQLLNAERELFSTKMEQQKCLKTLTDCSSPLQKQQTLHAKLKIEGETNEINCTLSKENNNRQRKTRRVLSFGHKDEVMAIMERENKVTSWEMHKNKIRSDVAIGAMKMLAKREAKMAQMREKRAAAWEKGQRRAERHCEKMAKLSQRNQMALTKMKWKFASEERRESEFFEERERLAERREAEVASSEMDYLKRAMQYQILFYAMVKLRVLVLDWFGCFCGFFRHCPFGFGFMCFDASAFCTSNFWLIAAVAILVLSKFLVNLTALTKQINVAVALWVIFGLDNRSTVVVILCALLEFWCFFGLRKLPLKWRVLMKHVVSFIFFGVFLLDSAVYVN